MINEKLQHNHIPSCETDHTQNTNVPIGDPLTLFASSGVRINGMSREEKHCPNDKTLLLDNNKDDAQQAEHAVGGLFQTQNKETENKTKAQLNATVHQSLGLQDVVRNALTQTTQV